MARRNNIVSFDEARRASSGNSRTRSDFRSRRTAEDQRVMRSSSVRRRSNGSKESSRSARTPQTSVRSEAVRGRSRIAAADAQPHADASKRGTQRTGHARQTRSKVRIAQRFDRQYGSSAPASPEEGAPRAALYKGKMGSSQKRSARMQRASQAGSVSAKINPAGWFSHLNLSSRMAKAVTAAVCLVFACAFLYAPARQYYQAQRENQRLEIEYATVTQRNEALDAHNASLASDAGMEDAVRQKFGYITYGEQTAVVTGLSDEVDSSKRANANVEANILASSIKAPEEWYTPILDIIFGVE